MERIQLAFFMVVSLCGVLASSTSSSESAGVFGSGAASSPTPHSPPTRSNYTTVAITIVERDIVNFKHADFHSQLVASMSQCHASEVTILSYGPTLLDELIAVDVLFAWREPTSRRTPDVLAQEFIFFTTKLRSLEPLTEKYTINSAVLDPTKVVPAWALTTATNRTDDAELLDVQFPGIMEPIGIMVVTSVFILLTISFVIYYLVRGRSARDPVRYSVDDSKMDTGCTAWVLGANTNISDSMKQGRIMGDLLKREENVKLVACGYEHTIIVTSRHRVFVGGGNARGQLGLGHNRRVFKFERSSWFDGMEISSVVCGSYHTAVVDADGKLYTFGSGDQGVLGHGDWADQWTPREVTQFHDTSGPPEHPVSEVRGIASGAHHLIVETDDGVWSWGSNDSGQLMLGEEVGAKCQCTPQRVTYFQDYGSKIREIVCGDYHTFVLCGEWEIYACGWNGQGQLGMGHYNNLFLPELVPVHESTTAVRSISTSSDHTLVATDSGVYSCGAGVWHQLGLGEDNHNSTTSLTWISALEGNDIVTVYAKGESSVFVGNDHAVVFACGKSEALGMKAEGAGSTNQSHPNVLVHEGVHYLNKPSRIDIEELLNVPPTCRTSSTNVQHQRRQRLAPTHSDHHLHDEEDEEEEPSGGRSTRSSLVVNRRQELLEAEGDSFPSIRHLVMGRDYTMVLVRLGDKLNKNPVDDPDDSSAAERKKKTKKSHRDTSPPEVTTKSATKSVREENPLNQEKVFNGNDPFEPPRKKTAATPGKKKKSGKSSGRS